MKERCGVDREGWIVGSVYTSNLKSGITRSERRTWERKEKDGE